MADKKPIILQDEHARKAVVPELTVGDMCMESIEEMVLRGGTNTQSITVLCNGVVYYFDLTCIGVRMPYDPKPMAPGVWMGQEPS